MPIGEWVPIFDEDGKPTVLHSGNWFCFGCNRKRIFIPNRQTGTLKTCCPDCGSSVVFQHE